MSKLRGRKPSSPAAHLPTAPTLLAHGASEFATLRLDCYEVESAGARGNEDPAGDEVFRAALTKWRERVGAAGTDPLGDAPTEQLSTAELDEELSDGDAEAGGVIQGAMEEFSQQLCRLLTQLLRRAAWEDTRRIVVAGDLRHSRVGDIALGRAGVLLKAAGFDVELVFIRKPRREATLLGTVRLVPAWMLKGHDTLLAIDIAAQEVRGAIVALNFKKSPDLSKASVEHTQTWRPKAGPVEREGFVTSVADLLEELADRSRRKGDNLAPFVGIGCGGVVRADGCVTQAGAGFAAGLFGSGLNLPLELCARLPKIGDHDTVVALHNGIVLQGLSQDGFMRDVPHWGIVSIAEDRGEARFTNYHETREKIGGAGRVRRRSHRKH